jgi:hypothetical protein
MSSAPSSGGTKGLCNPFLSNGSVNTLRRKQLTSPTIETVFSVGSVQSAYKRSECSDRVKCGQAYDSSNE